MNKENINSILESTICIASDFGITGDLVVSSPLVISQAVRVHRQNSRQGTVACKSRSDLISRSNKKPWKQKGTGRARAGSPRSPLWRGGGVCFGPQKRTRTLSIPKKMNRNGLKYLFLSLLDDKKIIKIDFSCDKRSTKEACNALKQNNLYNRRIILLYDVNDADTYYSFSNISFINLVSFDAVYPYILANDNYIVYLNKNDQQFKDMVNTWLI